MVCQLVRLHKYQISRTQYDLSITLYYQFMPRTLREYLDQLTMKGQEMGEKQLFSLIYGVESGLLALEELGIAHGCINLQTILFKNNIFKITDVSSTTSIHHSIIDLTSYELVLQGNRQQFLSQKLLNNLSLSMMKPYDSNINDDFFSLGLIVLMIVAKGNP